MTATDDSRAGRSATADPVVTVRDLDVDFWVDGTWYPAVRRATFEMHAGETMAIVGEDSDDMWVRAFRRVLGAWSTLDDTSTTSSVPAFPRGMHGQARRVTCTSTIIESVAAPA